MSPHPNVVSSAINVIYAEIGKNEEIFKGIIP